MYSNLTFFYGALLSPLLSGSLDLDLIANSVNAETIFVFTEHGGVYYEDILKASETPKVFVDSDCEYQLRHLFGRNILSVVFLTSEWPEQLLVTFRKTLYRRHHTDVLFIRTTETLVPEQEWILKFFQWCWANGFHNVLVNMAKTEGLLTYNPFPEVQPIATTLPEYLRQRNNWTDFQGYKWRMSAGNNPPVALVYYDQNDKLQFHGVFPLLLSHCAKVYNATVELVPMPNIKNYYLGDCIQYLATGRVDICADVLEIKLYENIIIHMALVNHLVIVPHEQPIAKFWYFIRPFDVSVWLLIAGSVFYLGGMLGLVNRVQLGAWNIADHLMTALATTIWGSFPLKHVRGPIKYVVSIMLIVAGFIISNWYLAILSSILTTNLYDDRIQTIEDLAKYGIRVMATVFNKDVYKQMGVAPELVDTFVDLPLEEYNEYRHNLDTKYAFINFYETLQYYLYQQKFLKIPKLKALQKVLGAAIGGPPFVPYWPFEEVLYDYMIQAFAGGFIDRFLTDTIEEAIRLGYIRFFRTETLDAEPLDLAYFEMPTILLVTGYLGSLLFFIGEKLYYRRMQARKIQHSVES